jgi:hypothetical protein
MKSGNLNFLEPSGPLQACKGTALPFVSEMSAHICKTTSHHIPEEGVFMVTSGRTSNLTCMKQSTTSVSVIAVRLSERIDIMQPKD